MKSNWRKTYDKWNKDGELYILFTFLIIGLVVFTIYKTSYFVYYHSECQECVKWKTYTNGNTGKFRREWEECVKYRYYPCLGHTVYFTLGPHQDSIIGKNGVVRVYE